MKYFAFGLTIETKINFDGILQESFYDTDVLIEERDIPEKASQLTRIKRRGIQARFGKTEMGFILNWEGIGKFNISDGKLITYQNLGADEGTLRLFLLSEVIGILLHQRSIFLLHASAVKVNDKAIVFMGIPGAGKSTTAAAFGKAGYTVLTDDLVAIKFVDEKPYVIPAFSQYKAWKSALDGLAINFSQLEPSFEGATKFLIIQSLGTFPKECVSLGTINLLYPPTSRIREEKINPLHAPVELLKHFPLPVQLLARTYLQQHFFQSLQLTKTTPIHVMKRAKNFQDLQIFVTETGSTF